MIDRASMPVLSARNVAKAYGDKVLFHDISLTVRRGEKVGLLGKNGTGKSSLLRVLAGIEVADGGVIEPRRDAKIRYLAQEPELDPAQTPTQIVAAVLPEERAHEADAMLERLGIGEALRARTVGEFSGGERRRVALARILVEAPDLAILDEPTNHLDIETIAWLETHLADTFAGAVLLVTHDRYVLDAITDRIFELSYGELREFDGSYGDYLEAKAIREEHEARTEQNRQNILRRERAWLMRGAKARTTKQKARIQRAKALEAAGPRAKDAELDFSELQSAAPQLGKTVLEFRKVDLGVGGDAKGGGRTLVAGFDWILRAGERIGVVGPNGAGKTTLLRAASGEVQPIAGEVVRGVNTHIAVFDQLRAALEDDWSIYDNVAEREGAERTGGGNVVLGERVLSLRQYLELFSFDAHAQRKKVNALSGGERARVALARALRHGSNLLILDEPTNDLDVDTLAALEELLASWPGVVIVVSHDRFFLDRVTTSILAFPEVSNGPAKLVQYAGNYSDSVEARKAAKKIAVEASRKRDTEVVTKTTESVAVEIGKPLTYAERIELEGILDAIANAEEGAGVLEAELADPEIWAKLPARAQELQAKLVAAHAEVQRLTARWEDLEQRKDIKRK